MTRRISSPVCIGRDEELEALEAALKRAADGQLQGVLVAADSGVGKTRLLREFRQSTEPAGTPWVWGECIELAEGELPYAPIVAALHGIWREAEDQILSPNSTPELARLIPAADRLRSAGTDLLTDDDSPAELSGELAQSRLFSQFADLLTRLGARNPVAFAVEDLHWADRSTRDLLSFLLRSGRDIPVLVIGTYRSDELHRRHPLRPFLAEHERLVSVERLDLGTLTPSEATAQLEAIVGAAPDPELAAGLFERSEGNPFFTEELLAASRDGERLPRNIRDALLLRVEALPQSAQEVLRVAAAAGRRVSHALLAEVADLPEPELTDAIREAVWSQVLVQEAEQESYAFRHALLGEVVSADLLPGERTRQHLSLAEALAANPSLAGDATGSANAELAFHWRACHRLEEALSASVGAGAEAEGKCARAEADRHFENALEIWDRVEDPESHAGMDRAAILLRAAQNASWSGQAKRAVALARAAVAETDATSEKVRAALARERLGEFLHFMGDSDGALGMLREAVELLPSEPPTAERARVLTAEGRLLMLHARPEEARSRCAQAIAIARETGEHAEEGRALIILGCALLGLGDRARAIQCLQESLQIAEEFSPVDLCRAYANLAEGLEQDGRVEEAVELGIEGSEVVRRLGQISWLGWIHAGVASRLLRLGRIDEAATFAASGVESLAEGVDASILHSIAAEIELQRGTLEQARIALERADELAGSTTDRQIRGTLIERQALLAVVEGDPDRAVAVVDRAIEDIDGEYLFFTGGTYAVAVRAHADRAERARAKGDPEAASEAERAGAALMERFEGLLDPDRWLDSPPPESVARAELAAAELGRLKGESNPETWAAVGHRWRELGFSLDLAYSDWRQAEAILAAGGTKAAAAEPLREAVRLAADSGAASLGAELDALARRARIDLGDTGDAAGSEPVDSAVDQFGLTNRELDVLELVADGRTNREIGEALFISAKTASAHVSHILAKLDVRSRIDAATAAHRLGLIRPASRNRVES